LKNIQILSPILFRWHVAQHIATFRTANVDGSDVHSCSVNGE